MMKMIGHSLVCSAGAMMLADGHLYGALLWIGTGIVAWRTNEELRK